jgi:hypothetical protein
MTKSGLAISAETSRNVNKLPSTRCQDRANLHRHRTIAGHDQAHAGKQRVSGVEHANMPSVSSGVGGTSAAEGTAAAAQGETRGLDRVG